jgi:O-antigen/teichoic acid export membrane protein
MTDDPMSVAPVRVTGSKATFGSAQHSINPGGGRGEVGPELGPSFSERVDSAEVPPVSVEASVAAASAWGLGGRVVLLLANLVSAPFLIRLLGPARYGLWALMQAFLTWASLAGLGMWSASTKFASESFARKDGRGEASVVFTSTMISAVTSGAAATVIAIEATPILADLLRVRGGLLSEGSMALRIVCAVFVTTTLTSTLNTPLQARLLWRPYTVINVAGNLVAIVGVPVALLMGSRSLVVAAAVGLIGALLGMMGNLVMALRLQPKLLRPVVDGRVLRQLVGYGGALTVANVASLPLETGERFFLAHNHGTTVVAYYAVAATLATALNVLPEQLSGPLRPAFTRLATEHRFSELESLYRKGMAGLFLVLSPAAIMLAVAAHPFLALWAGPRYAANGTGPLLVLLGGVWFNSLAWMPYSYLLSQGRMRVITAVPLAEVAPYLALAWLLTAKLGAMGAALAWSLVLAVDAIVWYTVVWRKDGLPIVPLPQRGGRSVLALAGLVAAALVVVVETSSLVARAGFGAGLTVAYGIVVWVAVLSTGEREGLLELVREGRHNSGQIWMRRPRGRRARCKGSGW